MAVSTDWNNQRGRSPRVHGSNRQISLIRAQVAQRVSAAQEHHASILVESLLGDLELVAPGRFEPHDPSRIMAASVAQDRFPTQIRRTRWHSNRARQEQTQQQWVTSVERAACATAAVRGLSSVALEPAEGGFMDGGSCCSNEEITLNEAMARAPCDRVHRRTIR